VLMGFTIGVPVVIMSDNPTWTQSLLAFGLATLGAVGMLVFSLFCLSGDIAESERQQERDLLRRERNINEMKWQEIQDLARKRAK